MGFSIGILAEKSPYYFCSIRCSGISENEKIEIGIHDLFNEFFNLEIYATLFRVLES